MRMAVTMCHATRPKYTARSLAAVVAARDLYAEHFAVRIPILMHVEPGNADTIAVCQSIRKAGDHVVVNPLRKLVNRNTVAAIDHGFESGADFVVHVEDDILLAPDALAYFAWAAERFAVRADDGEPPFTAQPGAIATVTGYHREPDMPGSHSWWAARARNWFHPWAWGTWRDRWVVLREVIEVDEPLTWDIQVNTFMLLKDWCEVFPTLARAQNIGHYSSIHPGVFSPEWYREHHTLKHWAGHEAFGGNPPGPNLTELPWSYVGRDAAEDAQRVNEKAALTGVPA